MTISAYQTLSSVFLTTICDSLGRKTLIKSSQPCEGRHISAASHLRKAPLIFFKPLLIMQQKNLDYICENGGRLQQSSKVQTHLVNLTGGQHLIFVIVIALSSKKLKLVDISDTAGFIYASIPLTPTVGGIKALNCLFTPFSGTLSGSFFKFRSNTHLDIG